MRNCWKTPGSEIRAFVVLLLLLIGWFGTVAPTVAQGYTGVVVGALTCDDLNSCWNEIGAQFSVTTEDREFLGSCTVTGELDARNAVEACIVEFPLEVTGTLIVTEDVGTITPGYVPEENPIFIDTNASSNTRPSHDVVFRNVPAGGSSSAAQTSDIAIVATENGQSVTDACFILTTFGNSGCDDNGDGKTTFRDVPLGTYMVHQTADLGPGRSVDDFTISVTGAMGSDGWERFGATVTSTGGSSDSGRTGITAQESANGGIWQLGIQAKTDGAEYPGYTFGAHFTVTAEDGTYLGECTLEPTDREVAWWNCKVDVPSDSVSLVWEDLDSIPPGYAPVENPITFDPTTYVVGPHGIGASFVNVLVAGNATGSTTSATGTRDIALITRDPNDGHLVLDGCYILLEYGNAACDENGDGQITYIDVPVGTYTVHQTQTPSGYPAVADFEITVDNAYQEVPLGYVVRQAPAQNAPGTRNVSVVFVDSRSQAKVQASICVQLVGGSERACDDALVDGQIDFLDVPAGTYPIDFSGLPAGWQIVTGSSVTFDAGPGTPANQFVYVEVSIPDSASTTSGTGSGATGEESALAETSNRAWTAAVTVVLCDARPDISEAGRCVGGSGVLVNFVLSSGEHLGSCTTGEPISTPWGDTTISTCSVEGMPFNAEIIATQDPSTIPVGYVPLQERSVVQIGNTNQGGGDGTPFYFANYLAGSSSASSSASSGTNVSASATLLMTFRGCPEGFDPAVDDYFASCTIPLDAPDASVITWGEGGSMNIAGLDRQYDGAYIFAAGPYMMNIFLSGLAPVIRDAYTVIGADGTTNVGYSMILTDGETREVFIFYYFFP